MSLLIAALPLHAEEQQPDGYNYDPAVGWFWYNQPQPPADAPPDSATPPPAGSPTDQMKRLQAFRDNVMNEAMLHPTVQNIRRYKIVQDWMVNQASQFASKWEQVLLNYPELDYSLQHPYYNGTANIQYTQQRKKQKEAIDYVNQRYGVFFFYRGNEPLDNRLGGVVKEFSEQYGLPVVAVSVDGRISPDLPDSRHDAGQAEKMHIQHFPAIFLVDPRNKKYQPLAYGFITQDDLARRMLNIVTNFKPED
ncbi:type-F conjugative transfer system pilin assembly protein TraF [Pantoea sp. Acro-835]|uniref:Type-F conjugative transfer system pilin assembly protein TraF n=1 Tax=Candidatus Pantoea multigeneris TaxID=2608357 RepID=A0ABX0RF02_9GAMM|nr:type-F conjugative transfer system pilin assembly protein TraF [Pantoea multigeneris]